MLIVVPFRCPMFFVFGFMPSLCVVWWDDIHGLAKHRNVPMAWILPSHQVSLQGPALALSQVANPVYLSPCPLALTLATPLSAWAG